jgi:hypothetical protein
MNKKQPRFFIVGRVFHDQKCTLLSHDERGYQFCAPYPLSLHGSVRTFCVIVPEIIIRKPQSSRGNFVKEYPVQALIPSCPRAKV